MSQAARGPRISFSPATGAARFVRFDPEETAGLTAQLLSFSGGDASQIAQADAFWAAYGSIFGIKDRQVELQLVAEETDFLGAAHLSFRQIYQGVPVFSGLLRAHFDPAGRLSAVNGTFIPDISVDPVPTLGPDQASAIAISAVGELLAGEGRFSPSDYAPQLNTRDGGLFVYRLGLTKGVSGPSRLVYQVEVSDGGGLRWFIYVDAHSGKVIDQVYAVQENLHRRVFEGGYGASFQVWEEGDPLPFTGSSELQTENINNILSASQETYHLFASAFGRDGFDGAGAVMETVNNDPKINCPNANWNGVSTNFCTGVTGDDTVAHEWAHAYTEFTHGLVYQWQPGALNEAYSDIWGEVVDLLNERGSDNPGGLRTALACSTFTSAPPVLQVNAPASIAGSYPAGKASFGPLLPPAGLTGLLTLVDDGVGTGAPPSTSTTDACEPLVNQEAIRGRIALIERGSCNYTVKVKNAQQAGAVAVLISNHIVGGNFPIALGGSDASIQIPSLSVGYDTGQRLRTELTNGVNVTLGYQSLGPAPDVSYRWLSGEDDPAFGESIRDLWNPSCYGDPGKVSDPNYACDLGQADHGGVHTNSGVPNHAFALLVDGGEYNGQAVSGIGLTKAAHLYWRAQAVYQTPTSDFADHADALVQACLDLAASGANLTGLNVATGDANPSNQLITLSDCQQVEKAIAAVELRAAPKQCNFQPLLDPIAPPLCPGDNGPTQSIFSDPFESTPQTWTISTTGVYSSSLPYQWKQEDNLPKGQGGQAFFAVGDKTGFCTRGPGDVTRLMSLTSPPISLPSETTIPRLAFEHYFATEAGIDGGHLKIRVNTGAWQVVAAKDFTFNPYNIALEPLAAGNTNPLAGQPAFAGTNQGEVSGSWVQSQVDLSDYAKPGDTVELRFDFGTDGCGGVDGWYIDNVTVYACQNQVLPPQINVSSETLASTQEVDTIATQVFTLTNTGAHPLAWSILEGQSAREGSQPAGSNLSPYPIDHAAPRSALTEGSINPDRLVTEEQPGSNVNAGIVLDGSFEAGTPSPYWTEASLNFGTPLCTQANCGGPPPHSGKWHAWFGGADTQPERGSLIQRIIIPPGAASLNFWLLIGAYPGSTGSLSVSVDGSQLFSATEQDAAAYSKHNPVTLDLSAFADGETHELRFEESNPTNSGSINFYVDEVALNMGSPEAGCLPQDSPWLSVSPGSGTLPFGNSTPIQVTYNTTGLKESPVKGSLCIASNDPARPLISIPVSLTMHPLVSGPVSQQLFIPLVNR